MSRSLPRLRRATALLWLALLLACTPIIENYGYAPRPAELAAVEKGVSTKQDVIVAIGSPVSTELLGTDFWYYVSTRTRRVGYQEPVVIDRVVVALAFDENEVLSEIQRFGLKDGRPISLSRRITDTELGRLTIVEQFTKSFGRLDPTQVFTQ